MNSVSIFVQISISTDSMDYVVDTGQKTHCTAKKREKENYGLKI